MAPLASSRQGKHFICSGRAQALPPPNHMRRATRRAAAARTCGGEMKSRLGTGIFLTRYSHTASMLYLSCAEMGTMGAPSAIVPCSSGGGDGGRIRSGLEEGWAGGCFAAHSLAAVRPALPAGPLAAAS